MSPKLSHFNQDGRPQMVDVSNKDSTLRLSIAAGYLQLTSDILEVLTQGTTVKGSPWEVARLGAIAGVKATSMNIKLCHSLSIDSIEVDHYLDQKNSRAWLCVTVKAEGKTGVEMEALSGVTIGLLNLYDMLKAVSHSMTLGPIQLLFKSGGKSGIIANSWDICPWKPPPKFDVVKYPIPK